MSPPGLGTVEWHRGTSLVRFETVDEYALAVPRHTPTCVVGHSTHGDSGFWLFRKHHGWKKVSSMEYFATRWSFYDAVSKAVVHEDITLHFVMDGTRVATVAAAASKPSSAIGVAASMCVGCFPCTVPRGETVGEAVLWNMWPCGVTGLGQQPTVDVEFTVTKF
jgi:hypothetical protein